jgi:hypothetical protein
MVSYENFINKDIENVYGCDDDEFEMHLRTINELLEKNFDAYIKVPYEKRALFLPHCMCQSDVCEAKNTDKGFICQECGACGICEIKLEAEKLGYTTYTVGGGGIIHKILKNTRHKAIMGVACPFELSAGLEKVSAAGLPAIGILLATDGCLDTEADMDKVFEALRLKAE